VISVFAIRTSASSYPKEAKRVIIPGRVTVDRKPCLAVWRFNTLEQLHFRLLRINNTNWIQLPALFQ